MFLDIKCENVDEKIWIKFFFLGFVIFDIIFELVKVNKDMVLFLLYDIEWVYGKLMFDIFIIEEYEILLVNVDICKIFISVWKLF